MFLTDSTLGWQMISNWYARQEISWKSKLLLHHWRDAIWQNSLSKKSSAWKRLRGESRKTRFQFCVIDILQLESVFSKFKTPKGCGADGIASYFLKITFPVIWESLCDIFNLSVATGCFPNSWKIATVAPIFKTGQPDDRSNYRSISVLPVVARIFEN